MSLLSKAKKLSNIIRWLPFNNKIKLKGAKLKSKNSLLLKTKIRCIGQGNTITISEGAILYKCSITINGNNNHVEIGKSASLKHVNINVEDSDNNVSIGERTYLCGYTNIGCIESTSIKIGNDCLFSANIEIRSGDSHGIYNLDKKRINFSKDVEIGNCVWLGQGVYVLKGVKIEENTVVGAGSIVTKCVEEKNCIVAGNPAKIIKRDIVWDKERVNELK